MEKSKRAIIEMLDKINNKSFIDMIFGFVRRLYQESGARDDAKEELIG